MQNILFQYKPYADAYHAWFTRDSRSLRSIYAWFLDDVNMTEDDCSFEEFSRSFFMETEAGREALQALLRRN